MKTISGIVYISTISIFGIATALLFGILYENHLLYIEGTQMFLFSKEYFNDTVFSLGGLGDYISQFLIQFYKSPILGGIIIAVVLISIQQAIAAVFRCLHTESPSSNQSFLILSILPSIVYCVYMCSENFTLNGAVALSAAIWTAVLYSRLKKTYQRAIFGAISVPIIYLTFGGSAIVTLLIIIAIEIIKKENRKLLPILTTLASATILVLTAKFIAPQLNDVFLLFGGVYYKYAEIPFKPFIIIYLSVILCIIAYAAIPSIKKWWVTASLSVFLLAIYVCGMVVHLDMGIENTMFYLFSAKRGEWSEIISFSNKHPLNSFLAANITNLALAKNNVSGSSFFKYPQPKSNPFILDSKSDILYGGEVLFNLGLINEAQRYAFESMILSADKQKGQKGTLFLTRLAECNMVAGREKVALTYYKTLQKTLFYRKWATKRIELMNDSTAFAKSYYGELRRMQPKREFYFKTTEFEQVLKDSFTENPNNLLLYNYLMMSYLHNKNITDFCKDFVDFQKPIPTHYQEALILACKLSDKDPKALPLPLDNGLINAFDQFFSAYQQGNDYIINQYHNTFWFHFHTL